MSLDPALERIRETTSQAATQDLLDRVTVYRAGMEPEALEIIEEELQRRNVTNEQIRQHEEEWGRDALWQEPGLAYRCSFCEHPATSRRWRWHRLLGLIPLIPRQVYLCREHSAVPAHRLPRIRRP